MAEPGRAAPGGGQPRRGRGRPRLDIDPQAVADTVAELFAEGGIDAVTMSETATRLLVSRATLYRSVRTKQDLLGILFERSIKELTESARTALAHEDDPRAQLEALVRLQVDAAIRMREYLPVFFGGGDLPHEVYARWQVWSREFERLWVGVVEQAIERGQLRPAEPVVLARLILGMCLWVCRWYRPDGAFTSETIADTAIGLLNSDLTAAAPPPGPSTP